ncbi:polysaccharide biosynthesis tyrosine autokinase [Flavobacteriales bacterium]|nr:polysaccharide biosynthesis tyrosine autokinase [Flavobacteriales bacterium]
MNSSNFKEINNEIDLKKEFFKFFFFWKYFLFSILFFLFCAYIFNRYTPKVYDTAAKIQILDKKQSSMEMPSAEDLFSNSKINLENEIEILKSYSILERVIKNLDLNIYIEGVGNIMSSQILSYPFKFTSKIHTDSLKFKMSFNCMIKENGLLVTNIEDDKEYFFADFSTFGVKHDLPFEITDVLKKKYLDNSYNIFFVPTFDLITSLKKSIIVSQVGIQSDIVSLNIQNSNSEYSRNILNEIIDVFNQDGIEDRQLIHKRTIDFVNERYVFLSSELESIEIDKQSFKVKNNLINLPANSNLSLKKSSISEETIFLNETQTFLASNLLDDLLKLDFELFPLNIGIDKLEVNSSIQSYNELLLEYKKLIVSVGPNNPYVKQLNSSIVDVRENIINSVKSYLLQLNKLNDKLTIKANSIKNNVANIPSQEKDLREIERSQKIKETLYLYLLQKGEEAQVSYAITEPSVKVVEYAISNTIPVSPKTNLIFFGAILIGLIIPFGIFYFIFMFDTKVNSKDDLQPFSFNFLGDIPYFDLLNNEKLFSDPTSRDIIAESFRMLMSNVKYLFKSQKECNVMIVSSSIKGEGKTLTAMNLSLAFASLNKKILLIGCDLRNPQIHKHIYEDKNTVGLVNFLVDPTINWRDSVLKKFDNHPTHDTLLSGALPPNPLNLINNGNFDILIDQAKKVYDYIIIDSAPTLLVADTKSIYHLADTMVYMTRAGLTEKEILKHIDSISKENDINIGVVLNGVGEKNAYGYSYGYQYGYGYNYKYSYNYGYGYGYAEDKDS